MNTMVPVLRCWARAIVWNGLAVPIKTRAETIETDPKETMPDMTRIRPSEFRYQIAARACRNSQTHTNRPSAWQLRAFYLTRGRLELIRDHGVRPFISSALGLTTAEDRASSNFDIRYPFAAAVNYDIHFPMALGFSQ